MNNENNNSVEKQKMLFIYNAIIDGWEVKYKDSKYIFRKKHENNKEIYSKNFIKKFIEKNLK